MSLEADVVTVLQSQCARVFPATAPLNTQRPFLTWEHIGGDPLRYVDGSAAAQRMALLQVNVWAGSKLEAIELSLGVEQAMCSAAAFSCRAAGAMRGSTEDQVEPVLYGTVQEFEVLGTR